MSEFLVILSEQDEVATKLLRWQAIFRKAVQDKNWAKLMSSAQMIDELTNEFNALDAAFGDTADGAVRLTSEEAKLASAVKQKLLKIQIENKATSDYIRITRDFVQKLIATALPQSRPKLYTRRGYQSADTNSVVLNALM